MLSNAPVAGTESPRAGDVISTEGTGTHSREQVKLLAANDAATSLVAGSVLGQQNIGSAGTFATTSTGFTCSAIVLSALVLNGVYQAIFTSAGAVGEFELFNPLGILVGSGKVGTAFTGGGLAFTLTDAGAHAVLGDVFTITVGTAAFARPGGDTGNFTCGAITVDLGFVPGVYTGTMIDATHFGFVASDGTVLPNGVFGTAYHSGGLDFTLTAGGAPAIAGDTFTITTNEGSGKYTAVSASAIDGSQNAKAVLVFPQYIGGPNDLNVAVIARGAELKKDLLAYPSGSTDDNVRNWNAQLTALGMLVRIDLV